MERAAAVGCGGPADGEGRQTARVGGMSVWAGSTLGWALGGYVPWGGMACRWGPWVCDGGARNLLVALGRPICFALLSGLFQGEFILVCALQYNTIDRVISDGFVLLRWNGGHNLKTSEELSKPPLQLWVQTPGRDITSITDALGSHNQVDKRTTVVPRHSCSMTLL